jgi:hypothetical protein
MGGCWWEECLPARYTCSHFTHVCSGLTLHTVMIVSYETLRNLTVHLNNCKIGLLLCDEGHRLKNSGTVSSITRICTDT